MIRQGDVLLVPVASIPRGEAIPLEGGQIVLAHGEATGHVHSIKSRRARFTLAKGRRFLMISEPAKLEHQEHDAIDIPPGKYEVIRQKEYAPQAIRNVAD